ncbi:hypothetical protein HJC23_007382 [Cyclotella cryptica]|uniref:Orc1-like AAA ATPase domain-containing protein n=1 Tax=Cyclotella cryptica TaxID=29204 RepID=A0ABD3Q5D9_9STRA
MSTPRQIGSNANSFTNAYPACVECLKAKAQGTKIDDAKPTVNADVTFRVMASGCLTMDGSPVGNDDSQQHHSFERSTTHQSDSINNEPSLVVSIPLRQWITGALRSNKEGTFRNGTDIPPMYLMSCLQIAHSLSRQLSHSEEFSIERLRSLTLEVADWAGSIAVKLKRDGNDGEGGKDDQKVASLVASAADSELDKLEALLDSICEGDEIDDKALQSICFHHIESAEIFMNHAFGSIKQDGVGIDFRSSEYERQLIHSLGLVFCELFSGGRLKHNAVCSEGISDEQLHPARSFDEGSLPASFRRLDLASSVKLDSHVQENHDGRSHNAGAQKKPLKSMNSFIESLKQLGLPYRLCDLLHNMLDCINGDLSGDDAYKEMSDVTADLRLMIDEPMLFLHDIDVATLSSSGLTLNDNMFLRDAEFALLQNAYLRSTSGSSEFAVISGGSGTGKSHLAFHLGNYITSNGGIFLSIKFDQLMQANPFTAIVSAFNDYCTIFKAMQRPNGVESIAFKLRDALGQDAQLLSKLIPNLSEILDCNTIACDNADNNQDSVHGQKKILYLLIRFIEVISACSKRMLTLFLDDLQWSDDFSLQLLQQIIMLPNDVNRFFFIGCYRDEEMEDDHSFKKMVGNFINYGIRMTAVRLECMDRETLQRMVSTLLCLSPRLVRGLSDIVYHKIKGNPLFVARLLVSLNRDGLLNLSLSRYRWTWDEALIKSRELPDDVASFFSGMISRLPRHVQTALQVLSCFGSAETCELIILEAKLGLELTKPLEFAFSEGFVYKNDDKYQLSHDQIQEALYMMVPVEHQCLAHLQYGLCLVEVFLEKQDDCILFTALGQLNLAGPTVVSDANQSASIATYNLIAGKKAIEMSQFSCAARFFNSGISFLKENHWADHYSLSLEIFGSAAKCALVLGDLTFLAAMSREVDENVHCLDDKLDNMILVMSSLSYESKISESVELGFSILSQLGHELPTNYTPSETMSVIKQTLKDLSDLSDNDLQNYKKMTVKRHLMAMKCLAKLQLTTLQVCPNLQPIVTLKMVNMTIDHGWCGSSPVGFAYFASVLAQCGEMQGCYRFAKLAKSLVHQVGLKEYLGQVISTTTDVLCFFEPLQAVNEHRIQGAAAALGTGDVESACMIKLFYCGTILSTTSNLSSANDVVSQALSYMTRQNHLASYNYVLLLHENILVLLGQVASGTLTEERMTNRHKMNFYYQKMFLFFLLNNYDELKRYGERFFEFRMPSWLLLSSHIEHEFFGGLVSFRIYRETRDILWLERGKQCMSTVKLWAEQGSLWNFEHRLFLLEAEECHCCCDTVGAQTLYQNAIKCAKSHKFVFDEALAYELAGYFYLNTGMTTISLKHLMLSYNKYNEWGACFKVNKLFDFVQAEFGSVTMSSSLGIHVSPECQDTKKRK